MASLITLNSERTYASEARAVAAAEKRFGSETDGLRYFIARNAEGRFFPVFIGSAAIDRAVYFHFPVVA